jgi:hypothetical protein
LQQEHDVPEVGADMDSSDGGYEAIEGTPITAHRLQGTNKKGIAHKQNKKTRMDSNVDNIMQPVAKKPKRNVKTISLRTSHTTYTVHSV